MKSIIVGTDLEIQHFDTPKMKQYRVRLQLGDQLVVAYGTIM